MELVIHFSEGVAGKDTGLLAPPRVAMAGAHVLILLHVMRIRLTMSVLRFAEDRTVRVYGFGIGTAHTALALKNMKTGDIIASVATPIARTLRLSCIDPATNELRPDSRCNKTKTMLNEGRYADALFDVFWPNKNEK